MMTMAMIIQRWRVVQQILEDHVEHYMYTMVKAYTSVRALIAQNA